MYLERTVWKADSTVRWIIGLRLLAISVGAVLNRSCVVGAHTAIPRLGLVSNSLTDHCGGNALLRIDTSSIDSCTRD